MLIDPRGQRFAAAITAVVLAAVLLTANVWLLAAQTVVFAIGAIAGVRRSPYASLFRHVVRPRIGPPNELESPAPPQFAQAVGLLFGLVGVTALAFDATGVALVAVGLAFGAAFLNAAFGFCLGCEIYLLARRATTRLSGSQRPLKSENTTSTTTPEEITA